MRPHALVLLCSSSWTKPLEQFLNLTLLLLACICAAGPVWRKQTTTLASFKFMRMNFGWPRYVSLPFTLLFSEDCFILFLISSNARHLFPILTFSWWPYFITSWKTEVRVLWTSTSAFFPASAAAFSLSPSSVIRENKRAAVPSCSSDCHACFPKSETWA